MKVGVAPELLLRLIAGIAERLGQSTSADEIADVVLAPLAETLSADVANIALRVGQDTLRLVATVGLPHSATDPWTEFSVDAAVPLAASVRDARAYWLPDTVAGHDRFPALATTRLTTSLCTLPLRERGNVIGVLGLGWREHHNFSEAERQTLSAVAALTGAALSGPRPRTADPLRLHDHDSYDGVTIACLSREEGARCSVQRAKPGSRPGARSVFATLLDADPALPPSTLERATGVLGLCRRRRVPPALVGQAIADIGEDLDGPITGAHIEISDDTGWLAVAPLDSAVVIVSTAAGAGEATPPDEGVLAGERVVMASTDCAAVLVVALDASTDDRLRSVVLDAAHRATSGGLEGGAVDVLDSLTDELNATETLPCVRGALAVVLQPRPEQLGRSRALPAQPVSSLLGRRFALSALGSEAADGVDDILALITGELVSNAIRHAHEDIELTVTEESDGTKISVSDDDDRFPVGSGDNGEDRESGRGYALIDALSDDRGVTPLPSGGKVVWARLQWRGRR